MAVEPLGNGLMMSTLRTADEVRTADFENVSNKVDPEMVTLVVGAEQRNHQQ